MTERLDERYLTLSLGAERYAIPIGCVREVLPYTGATRLPRTADYMKGIISLRGQSLPVIDLRLRFGLTEADRTSDTAIIVVEMPDERGIQMAGFVADSVHEVLELGSADREDPPPFGVGPGTSFISCIGRDEQGFILILDLDLVFTEEGKEGRLELAPSA